MKKSVMLAIVATLMCTFFTFVSGCSSLQSKPSAEIQEQLARKSLDFAVRTVLKAHPTPYGLLNVTNIFNIEIIELHRSPLGELIQKESENKVIKQMWPVKVKAVVKADFYVDGLAAPQTQKGDIHYTMYIYKDEFGEYKSINGAIND